jgi:hypothetical protein
VDGVAELIGNLEIVDFSKHLQINTNAAALADYARFWCEEVMLPGRVRIPKRRELAWRFHRCDAGFGLLVL